MVDPSVPVADHGRLDELASLLDRASSGAAGLAILQGLLEAAVGMTGAVGAGFVELTPRGARMVAAAGALDWMRGRPISLSDPAITQLIEGPRLLEFARTDFGPNEERELAEHGLYRLARALAVAASHLAGYLVLGYADGAPELSRQQRSSVTLLSACAAHLYLTGRGLPVDVGDGPPGCAARDDRSLFIAVTSHELRTPVTVIRGYADTLIDRWEQLDERARRSAVSVIGQRARDLGRLLDRLMSAAGDGITDARPIAGAPFDMLDALRDAVDELPPDLRRHLRTGLPASLPKAAGDRGTVPTILTELVTNACKYSPDRVDVELTAGADPRVVWVRVADRGVGIRPEQVERAFDRFWQADSGDQRRYGGVGLGLYLVRRIVERQRGWVSLRPRPGGGTVAEVRLPRADVSTGEA